MKTYILMLIMAVICTTACKKDKEKTSPYYIRMTVDGSEKVFSDNPFAGEGSGDLTASFSMQAENSSEHTTFSIGVLHPFGVTLTEGEYNGASAPYIPGSAYLKTNVFTYYGRNENSITTDLIVSHLTSNTVSGTFSGWCYNSMNPQDSLHIENGSFYLPFRH